ncbi:MAG TPA: PAS domain-containing protein [Lysobacter sp.]
MKRVPFLFSSDSTMARHCRGFAWADSPLGHPAGWDTALKTLVPIVLASNQPMFIVWGESRTLLYNDAYAQILAGKHPDALGRDFLAVWHEIRDDLEPMVTAAYRGEPWQMDDIELWMQRRGYREETHFSFFYAPVRTGSGEVAGFFCACNEITAQILAERRLAASDARHRGMLENMEEGFVLLDGDFRILEANTATIALVDLPREALVGHGLWERFPGMRETPVGAMYREVVATQRAALLEHRHVHPDGREQWFEVRAFPVGDGLAALFRDVTERRRLQAREAAATERVQLALEAGAIVGTWIWDIPSDSIVADERFAASFGLDARDVAAGMPIRTAFAAIHPDDRARVEAAVADAVEQRSQYRCQYRILRHGACQWVEACGRVEVDADGRPTRFPGVLLDIGERRRAEAERDRAATLLRTFIEAVPGVVYAKDRDGRYVLANRGTAELLGRPPERFIGRTDAELLDDPDEAAAIMALDREIMASGRGRQAEEPVRRADGSRATWWSTKEPLHDADGRVIGLVGTSVDITERKRMVQALHDADRRKDEFLAMLAHELRNPLAPIGTAAHLLRRSGGDSGPVRDAAEVIARQAGHLTRLVDDLLDVSRVTRGRVQLERAPVDLRPVVATAVEQARPLLQARNHVLRTAIGDGPFVVDGDFHRLVQVVSNLLNNAAKYTPQGGTIEVRLDRRDGRALLAVTDDGIGIAPGTLDHIFDLFAQAERTPDRSQGGLGIGLSLVRSLVQLHGGDVRAESAGRQRGATFTVTLPLTDDVERPAPVPAPDVATGGLRILVVDDNLDAARTLAEVLSLDGHRVETAGDGAGALQAVRGHAWDALILDIGLPDMTGYELAGRLRERPEAARATFVALTGYGQAQDRAVSRTAGFDHHLVKPADLAQLHGILAGIARVAGDRPAAG